MRFLDLIFNRTEKRNEEINEANSILLESLLRGSTFTKEQAMSIPAVSSSVDKISSLVAMLPIKLYEKKVVDGEVVKQELRNDIRIKLLNEDTNDSLDPFQLKKAIASDYLLEKGAYVFIERKRNKVIALRYVNPNAVGIYSNADPIFKDGVFNVGGKTYNTYDFISVLRNTKNGLYGKSIIDEIKQSLETSLATITYELGLVRKGGAKKGFITSNKRLSEEAMSKLRSAWSNYYQDGKENVMILNEGLDFKEASNSSTELQVNERKRTLSDDIKDVFHISEDYNTTIKDAVMPIISAIESALNKTLLLEKEKGKLYFAFDTKKITRGSLKERYEAYKIASETGWLGINEIRTEEDFSKINGLDVIKMNLANVLYDVKSQKYYTPNTGKVIDLQINQSQNDSDINNDEIRKEVKEE